MACEVIDEIEYRILDAYRRYGDFASTHEALGVAIEEWDELRAAIHSNHMVDIRNECIDLAAVLIRLARAMNNLNLTHRSTK